MATRELSDPILLELVKNALDAVVEEMAIALVRTAYSNNLKNSMDMSCALCDADGRLIAQGLTLPLHLGSVPDAMAQIRRKFAGRVEPGTPTSPSPRAAAIGSSAAAGTVRACWGHRILSPGAPARGRALPPDPVGPLPPPTAPPVAGSPRPRYTLGTPGIRRSGGAPGARGGSGRCPPENDALRRLRFIAGPASER